MEQIMTKGLKKDQGIGQLVKNKVNKDVKGLMAQYITNNVSGEIAQPISEYLGPNDIKI